MLIPRRPTATEDALSEFIAELTQERRRLARETHKAFTELQQEVSLLGTLDRKTSN